MTETTGGERAALPADQGALEAGLDVAAVLDRDRLAKVIYEASDEWDWNGVGWEHQYGAPKREALAQADAVLAALAPLIAQREAEAVRVALEPVRVLLAKHLCERPDECAADGACMAWIPPRDLDAALAQAEATSGEAP